MTEACDPSLTTYVISAAGLRGVLRGSVPLGGVCFANSGFAGLNFVSCRDPELNTCTVESTVVPETPRCRPRVAAGGLCYSPDDCALSDDPEVARYCPLDQTVGNVCQHRKDAGEPCQLPIECKSLTCVNVPYFGTARVCADATVDNTYCLSVVPPTAGDGADCRSCGKDLNPARAIDCFCHFHQTVCSPSLAAALGTGTWALAERGCGMTALWPNGPNAFGTTNGQYVVFDGAGTLVSAETWNDPGTHPCRPAAGDSNYNAQAGLPDLDGTHGGGLASVCATVTRCKLWADAEPPPGIGPLDLCDQSELLAGIDGG
jgi:hypothetical protein